MNHLDKTHPAAVLRTKDQDVPHTLMVFQMLDTPCILSFASILPSYLHLPLSKSYPTKVKFLKN